MLRWFVRGRNGREREIKRESVFCVLSFWCNKKERVFGPFKNLKKRRLSPSDKIFLRFLPRGARAKPSTRRCEPTRVVQNRIQNVVFREKPPATRPSRLRARVDRRHDSSTHSAFTKKRGRRQKGATRTYRFGDDRRSFLRRHRPRRRRRDPRVAARAARR